MKKLNIWNPKKTIDLSVRGKSVRLDVYVEDEKHTVFNLEMQATSRKNLPKRMRYYQGMIDLNILKKGGDYKELKPSYVIFICTFDPFGEGRHIYSFENRCIQDTQLTLGDDTVKIILNTKGTRDDIRPELKRLLDYIDGKGVSDNLTRDLEEAVRNVRQDEEGRLAYMTLQQEYRERYQEGKEEGIGIGRQEGIGIGKIELLYMDFHMMAPEIAQKLSLSEEYVKSVIDSLEKK